VASSVLVMDRPEHTSAQLVSKKTTECRLDRHVDRHALKRRANDALASGHRERCRRLSGEAVQPVGDLDGCCARFRRPSKQALCKAVDGLKHLWIKALDAAESRWLGRVVIGLSQLVPDDRHVGVDLGPIGIVRGRSAMRHRDQWQDTAGVGQRDFDIPAAAPSWLTGRASTALEESPDDMSAGRTADNYRPLSVNHKWVPVLRPHNRCDCPAVLTPCDL